MADILSLAGSPSASSRSSAILDYNSILERHQVSSDSVAIRDVSAEDFLFANFKSPDIQALYPKFTSASAVIVATHVYR